MFFYEGFSCPVCGKPFDQADDVVACPTCGAPHHRECWQQQGHCHFEADHGTDRQWSRERRIADAAAENAATQTKTEQRRCPHCGHDNPVFAEICAHCGQATGADDWQSRQTPPPPPPYQAPPYGEYRPFVAYDPMGGVSPDEVLDEVPAADLAAFVGTNTPYYLPRFRRFAQTGTKCSWNWAAFLMPSYWLLYRKQYVAGLLVLVFDIVRIMMESFVLYGALQIDPTNPNAVTELLMRMDGNGNITLFVGALTLSTMLLLLVRVLVGLAGNWLYFRTATARIRKLKGEAPTVDRTDIAAAGGVSLSLGIVGYVMVTIANMLAQYTFLS